jgi:ABC-2 type transport system ATP-binding protein
VAVNGRTLTCTVHGSFDALLKAIGTSPVENLVSREPSLEEVFLEYYRGDEPSDALSISP